MARVFQTVKVSVEVAVANGGGRMAFAFEAAAPEDCQTWSELGRFIGQRSCDTIEALATKGAQPAAPAPAPAPAKTPGPKRGVFSRGEK